MNFYDALIEVHMQYEIYQVTLFALPVSHMTNCIIWWYMGSLCVYWY